MTTFAIQTGQPATMIRWAIAELQEEYARKNKGKRLTVRAIAQSCELSPTTVQAMSAGHQKAVTLEVLDKLCAGLSKRLRRRVTLDDVLRLEPDAPEPDTGDAGEVTP